MRPAADARRDRVRRDDPLSTPTQHLPRREQQGKAPPAGTRSPLPSWPLSALPLPPPPLPPRPSTPGPPRARVATGLVIAYVTQDARVSPRADRLYVYPLSLSGHARAVGLAASQSLPAVPVVEARGRGAGRSAVRLPKSHGAGGDRGASGQRVGDHPPLHRLRLAQNQPHRWGRQRGVPAGAGVETAGEPAVSVGWVGVRGQPMPMCPIYRPRPSERHTTLRGRSPPSFALITGRLCARFRAIHLFARGPGTAMPDDMAVLTDRVGVCRRAGALSPG